MIFSRRQWREAVQQQLQVFVCAPKTLLKRTNVSSVYSFLIGVACAPLVAAHDDKPGEALEVLLEVIGPEHTLLLTHLQLWQFAPGTAVATIAQAAHCGSLPRIYDQIVQQLHLIPLTMEMLEAANQPEMRARLQRELTQIGKEKLASTIYQTATSSDDELDLGDISPFSLDDLGLNNDEIGLLRLNSQSKSALGLTEEELAGFDMGAFGEIAPSRLKSQSNAQPLHAGTPAPPEPEESTGDLTIHRLMHLGRHQGFVDLNDIIDVVKNPMSQPERIEEIGQALHHAGIEIRDGDEVIDMEEMNGEDEYPEAVDSSDIEEPAGGDEPELMPFSLSDLGLSDDEIAALRLEEGEAAAAEAAPAADPVAAPEQATVQEAPTEPASGSTQEPELTPFSLEDLGLSEEEIAAIESPKTGGTMPEETTAADGTKPELEPTALTAAAEEPELSPFSLSDLGLSAEEIAALSSAASLDETHVTSATSSPHLNTRFDGIGPDQPLPVGRRVPLVVWIGAEIERERSQSSRPFTYIFPDLDNPVLFRVRVRADPENWTIKDIEPLMWVTPPGTTTQEAEFLVIARQPGRDKLYISVEQADTGIIVQDIWLTVDAEAKEDERAHAPAVSNLPENKAPGVLRISSRSVSGATFAAHQRRQTTIPLDTHTVKRRNVRITVQQAGYDPGTFIAFVDADLPDGRLYQSFRIPLSTDAIQNATLRLRQELERIVFYEVGTGDQKHYPFTNLHDVTVDPIIARQTTVDLADVGNQVWSLLFDGPRTPDDLRQFAACLRDLPTGSTVQVVLDNPQVIIPWALLYDKPGPITADTLDWSGFWGYRYRFDVLVPGNYPDPLITDNPLGLHFVFNDDRALHLFTQEQARFVTSELGSAQCQVDWGEVGFLARMLNPGDAALLYSYCHGTHTSGAVQERALVGESALIFSSGRRTRLVDLKRLGGEPLPRRPLVFVNACEGATQDAFYYDGFMPFFIEQQGARGFIGTEVKVPTRLAHDFALEFLHRFAQGQEVGTILWELRRHYLDTHNTILAFNYSLYGLGETRLAQPLVEVEASGIANEEC
jgi:hypothetical protein